MTRWTINDDGNPECRVDHRNLDITWNDLRYVLWTGPADSAIDTAHEALVAAVRDADRLATLAYALRDIHCDDDGVCHEDGFTYPCSTARLVNELAPEDTP